MKAIANNDIIEELQKKRRSFTLACASAKTITFTCQAAHQSYNQPGAGCPKEYC
jgi:hypothetical protein